MPRKKNARPAPTAAELKDLAQRLEGLLRLRTLPIGMRLFDDEAAFAAVPGLRRPRAGRRFTTCQLVTQARVAGLTIGIAHENVRPWSNCGGVIGLNAPGEDYLSGRKLAGVWFADQENARLHQATMPRAPAAGHVGVVASPLRAARLDPPDICLFYGTPGQTILFVNGLQHARYRRYDMSITGESACADSWGRALKTRKTSISIPCYAERRYGGVADDEMLVACPPDEFRRGVEGLEALAKVGLRYPIPPYGANADPAEGMDVSYGEGGKRAAGAVTATAGPRPASP
ncbi:MAG: DUF169 domain-containing protein [Alphaproteobacteria bacterium]|nr:DUF169 domain-containing protein [Alphaproteobacteria bacterium]